MLFDKMLPHPSEAADITGRLGWEFEVGIVIVAVFGVSYYHVFILLFEFLRI